MCCDARNMATSLARVATMVTGLTRIMRLRALCATSDANFEYLLVVPVDEWWALSGDL